MPSGPKKRLKAKRKKQGSPATDANSDRDTEALSVTGSVDVDDLDSGLDTPVKGSYRPAFLDSEAVSSQTDEWVRISDFDVGTPTSQPEENDPSAEDGDVGSSRRPLDKLAEWETISEEHIPGRQEGSINSLEEEPSECEAASAHSSESFTNLPSPSVAERGKDGDNSDSDRKNRLANRSTEAFDSSASANVGEDISSARHEPPLPTAGTGQFEPIERLNEANPVDGAHKQGKDEVPTASTEAALVETKSDDQVMSANGEDITPNEEKKVLLTANEKLPQGSVSGDEKLFTPSLNELGDQEDAVSASLVDVDNEEVSKDEKVGTPAVDDSSAADKEVASTSAKVEDEKSMVDVPNSEVATSVEKDLSDPRELADDSSSVKAVPTSGTSEPMALAEGSRLSISTPVEKNGAEKHRLEVKPLTGCCGVLYWLLGWEN